MEKARASGLRSKSLKQDDSIMGTNNSSIVSKRSVERLYYPNEPHFFRYFVKKPQRRTPLINRGYWLRMKAIDHVVHQFLEDPSDKSKVIINLGCGYDPLPWQCLTRYPEASQKVKFIDVDYMDLMLRKRAVVRETPQLNGMLTNIATYDSQILLQSDQYIQLGCDLRDLSNLSETLASVINLESSLVLFTSEVAITYMNVEASDALIQWAGTLPHVRFCLLEQIIPEGEDHPFAKTMMAHFEKLQTPLRAVQLYPTTAHQVKRFKDARWTDVSVMNLWELWDSDLLSSEDRISLDIVEPFDEWEEFALFGCHYFLLIAQNQTPRELVAPSTVHLSEPARPALEQRNALFHAYTKAGGYRRFAASLTLRGPDCQQDIIGSYGGMGLNTRVDSCDIYSKSPNTLPFYREGPKSGPSPRVCHTITDLGDTGSMLVGGRSSPDKAMADCWIYHKWTNIWERIDDIPQPRYRHSAVSLSDGRVLVMGGKRDSRTVIKDPLVWSRTSGWRSASLRMFSANDQEPDVFGALLVCTRTDEDEDGVDGLLMGGILNDGLLNQRAWAWTMNSTADGKTLLSCRQAHSTDDVLISRICRFGATTVARKHCILVIGGITADRLLKPNEEILTFSASTGQGFPDITIRQIDHALQPRPLLVGSSTMLSGDEVVIMGGGAVCFSMGTFWNTGCYTLQVGDKRDDPMSEINSDVKSWKYAQTFELSAETPTLHDVQGSTAHWERTKPLPITRLHITNEDEFSRIVAQGKPAILADIDLGVCRELWTNEYLLDRIGSDRQVIVHKAATQHMDFVSKNFEYAKISFGDFIDAITGGDRLYLRSLSVEKPSEQPADISRDFPTIGGDFHIPDALRIVIENAHSSPLRISGPVTMWLHYDVMANVLCQVRGTKRLLLFPPTDVRHFGFAPGSSSSSMNVFEMIDNDRLAQTHPYEAKLVPGEVLYIPPLWLHTTEPTDGISISVNVFFKNMSSGYAAGRDVYGNRDLAAYEKGRKDIQKIAKSFDDLPYDTRSFYLQRLADELSQKAGPHANSA